MNVLEFLSKQEIKEIFDNKSIKTIEYLLKKVLFSQPELLPGQKEDNIQIPKEFLEQWVAQGLGWERVGSGSYPIDVYSKEKKFGADVKFMSAAVDSEDNFKKGVTGESSLGQKFVDAGTDLDQDFASKEYDKILNGWKKILSEKMQKPIKDYDLKQVYYFIFLRGGNSIHLAVAKVFPSKIKNLAVKSATGKSVFVDGFIDASYGNVKIYKSKKRMELRCLPKKMKEDQLLISWDFKASLDDKGVNLRKIIVDELKFNKYVKKIIKKFFKTK
ncbi:hypothetical protein KKA15_03330 [Patescibacteria group bacterium]|nr:hypothetical protein [Patescibacteria group bacterium]